MYRPGYDRVPLDVVSTFTPGWGMGPRETIAATAPSSAAFESANRAVYFPLIVPATCVVRRVWWVNGTVVNASYNVDVGIYSSVGYAPGVKLVSSGSTAQGTASEVQFADVTDTVLSPGAYWLAITCSSTTATFFRSALTTATLDAGYKFQQDTALPLPSSATPVESGDTQNIYLFGFSTTASP